MNKNKQLKANIEALDLEIGVLTTELIDAEGDKYITIMEKIDKLTTFRCKLVESKVSESYSKEIVGGIISIAGMVLVLKHEKAEVITSKAWTMATQMFRG